VLAREALQRIDHLLRLGLLSRHRVGVSELHRHRGAPARKLMRLLEFGDRLTMHLLMSVRAPETEVRQNEAGIHFQRARRLGDDIIVAAFEIERCLARGAEYQRQGIEFQCAIDLA